MAEHRDICDQSSDLKTPADVTINATGDVAAAAKADEQTTAAKADEQTTTASDAKLPQAAQLAESAPGAAPPPFLREHETRIVAAKAAPVKAAAAKGKDKPKSRFPLLAATLALAAGLGGAAGAVGVPTLLHLLFGSANRAAPVDATLADLQALKSLSAQLTSELAALRTAAEQSNKTAATQFGKLNERLDRAERAQADPTAKLTKIGEALERLERRAAGPAAPAHNDVTGSVHAQPQIEAKPKPTILEDYVVRKVFDGVALVEGRRGIVEVEPGSSLPGAGRVEEIRRQDGRWVVVTSKGLIVPVR